jgi:hypothetical protein
MTNNTDSQTDMLPELTKETSVRLEVLMNMFFEQFWTFSTFINEDPKKFSTKNYAKYILWAFEQMLEDPNFKRK